MKYALALLAALALPVHAESFFSAEIGLGAAMARDHGDDIWIQKKGVPHSETLVSPAFIAGVSAELYRAGRVDLRARLDYTYFGQDKASCMCVSDAAYWSHDYGAARNYFNGFGHTQGISLTFEPGYTWHGIRFSVEAGPWVNWSTWHEVAMVGPGGSAFNASHRTVPELGWVAGAGIEKGHFGIHYRYYSVRQAWNPFPGLVTGAHMLLLQYRF